MQSHLCIDKAKAERQSSVSGLQQGVLALNAVWTNDKPQ